MKDGEYVQAKTELDTYQKKNKGDKIAKDMVSISFIICTPLINSQQASIKSLQKLINQTEKTYKAKRWSQTLESVTKALEIASNSLRLYQIRVDCYLALGDITRATSDLK